MSQIEGAVIAESIAQMRNLVELMARALVDDPGAVVVTPSMSEGMTCFRLDVGVGEEGKVIGKQGRTARSFRTILSAAGIRCKHRFVLDIAESRRKS